MASISKKLKHEYDLRIDGKAARVIVMKKSREANRVVYVPLTSLTYEDYKIFAKWQEECPANADMLDFLQKKRCPNNRFALDVYENVLSVAEYTVFAQNAQTMDEAVSLKQLEKQKLEGGVKGELPKGTAASGLTKEVYMFRDPKNGNKPRLFSKDGNKPMFIKDALDSGSELDDFKYIVDADASEEEIKKLCR